MDKKQKERAARIIPNGKPRYIRCYDNGGETADRYTVVFTGNYNNIGKPKRTRKISNFMYLGMSDNPFHPQGFGQHGDSPTLIDKPSYKHLGKKIPYYKLSSHAQLLVMQDYLYLWNFTNEHGEWIGTSGKPTGEKFIFSNGLVDIPD
jgi:hypothetical protein